MSEFAKAILKLPVSPERESEQREQNTILKQKAKLKDVIVHDRRRLSRVQRLIGFELPTVEFQNGLCVAVARADS